MTHTFFTKDNAGKVHLWIRKSVSDPKLDYFKRKIKEVLDTAEKREQKEVRKALIDMEAKYFYIEKAGYPIGTIREWKGRKFIKIAPGKWRPKYEKQTKGAKIAIAALRRSVDRCTSSEELFHLVLAHRSRFQDANGYPLPIVQELHDYVSKKNDTLAAQTGDMLRGAKWRMENVDKEGKRGDNRTGAKNGKEKNDSNDKQGGVPQRGGDLRQGSGGSGGENGADTGRGDDTNGTGLGSDKLGGGLGDGQGNGGVRHSGGVPRGQGADRGGEGKKVDGVLGANAQLDFFTEITEKPQEAEETEAEKHANRSAAMMGNKNAYKGIMDVEQFDTKYNSAFDKEELSLWRMMSADGTINADDITDKALLDYLKNSGKFIETADGVYESVVNYASGNVAQKLDALDEDEVNYAQKKALLEKALPPKKTLDHIHFSPLENWVQGYGLKSRNNVSILAVFDDWLYSDAVLDSELPTGISKLDIKNYIEGNAVRVNAKAYDDDKATAQMVANTIRRERMEYGEMLFNKFIFEGLSKDDAEGLRDYCYKRDCYVKPDYNKIPVSVDGMNTHKGEKEFTLTSQQMNGVTRLTDEGRGLLAYDVGVGKTVTGIAATVKQIQSGKSKRPLICVPKAVYKNWIESIHEHFPNQQVVELGNLSKNYYNGDAIPEGAISVCTYEALGKMNVDTNSGDDNECGELYGSIRDSADNYSVKDLGFDHVTIDEVHNFKNIFSSTKAGANKKGNANEFSKIRGSTSARAVKMLALTQYIQNAHGGKNVFALSATPFTNSPTEIYSMLSLIARDRLKAMGINTLYDFIARYAELRNDQVVKPNNTVETEQVVKSFHNLDNLQSLITEYIDKVDGDEAGVIRPHKVTHTPELELSAVQKKMIDAEIKRMTDAASGKTKDPAAAIVAMNNMRMITLSPALVDKKLVNKFVECSPKLKFVCDSIIAQWKNNPKNGQVIYMPRGVEHFDKVAEYLVKHGMPKDAIGQMAGGATTEKALDKRQALMEDFNNVDGKCKVIIGSGAIQEGVSLNGNATTIYNCMLGWNPSETQQVEGRVWRQGNKQGVTHIVYPLMNDSIDALMYQKYDEKQSRIDELWKYKGDVLNVSDINPEELKFGLIKDPKVRADLMIVQDKQRIQNAIRTNTAQADRLHNDAGIAFGDVKYVLANDNKYYEAKNDATADTNENYIWESNNNELKENNIALKYLKAKKTKNPSALINYGETYLNEVRMNEVLHHGLQMAIPPRGGTIDDVIKRCEQNIHDNKLYLKTQKETADKARKYLASAERNAQAKIDRMKDKLARQGIKSKLDVDKKIDVLTKERAAHTKELSGLRAKRAQYEADAKKQLAAERKNLPSVDEMVKRNVQSIESQLRPMDEVEGWIREGRKSGRSNAELKADIDKRVGVTKSWADVEAIAKAASVRYARLCVIRNGRLESVGYKRYRVV